VGLAGVVRKTVARLIASFQISDLDARRLQCSAAKIAAACGPSLASPAPPATAPPELSHAPDPGLRHLVSSSLGSIVGRLHEKPEGSETWPRRIEPSLVLPTKK
jgi:hypothetical protein